MSIAVAPGERFGLIGPNGSGKTTLINCVSGALRNDSGSIAFAGEEISALPAYQRTRRGIARSFQIPRPFSSMTVLENLIVPLEFVVHRRSLHKADTARRGHGDPQGHRARRQGATRLRTGSRRSSCASSSSRAPWPRGRSC